MQTLVQYLSAEKMSQAQLAKRLGVHQGTISKLCNGLMKPGWGMASKIEKATGGKVPVAVWAISDEAAQ